MSGVAGLAANPNPLRAREPAPALAPAYETAVPAREARPASAPPHTAAAVVPAPAPIPLRPPQTSIYAARAWLACQYLVFPLAVLLAWWLSSRHGWLPATILPGPDMVLASFWELLHGGDIAEHLGISLWRVAQGAALGVVLGLALGAALGTSDAFESWIGPSFRVLVQIPSIALIPLLMMVLGIDDALKLFIMTKACVVPLALITADGIRNIPPAYLEAARAMGLRQRTLYAKVVLPGALPAIATGVRQGVAHVWVALVAVEVMASADGIGYLMTWSRQLFQLDVVLVCVVLIGAIGFTLDFVLRRAELRLLSWRGQA